MSDLPLVIGTAGHVDHGKTSLIRSLTGVDTDRLVEEQRRGLTIDLGFAPFTLPSGRTASVVDVPGHEKFLKNMLAGAGGMDLVLLVVAADDGVMPQTREHLEILSLLHARQGVVVLTKTDLVDPELLELAREDVRSALAGSFLADAPVVDFAAPTEAGLPAVRAAIDQVAAVTRPRAATGAFRLAVDRVFVKQGFGTVVTGTLMQGTLREGDAVHILPAGLLSRVRGLQVHGGKREAAVAGQRVAVNLAGLERSELGRGDWLVPPDTLAATSWLDLYLELSPGAAPLKHRTRIRFHHGTAELLGRVRLLDREVLEPGTGAFVQVVLEAPAVAAALDRFILRRYAPVATLGGGVVLDPHVRRERRHHEPLLAALAQAQAGDWLGYAAWRLREAGAEGLTHGALEARVPAPARAALVAELGERGVATPRRERLVHRDARDQLEGQLLSALAQGHAQKPWRWGVPREALQAATKIPLKAMLPVLDALERGGDARHAGRLWALTGHVPLADALHETLRATLRARLQTQRFCAEADALAALAGPARDLLDDLIEAGEAVRLGQGMLASAPALAEARARLQAHLTGTTFTTSQARELLETNRKAIIPLMEYLDAQGFTKRQGDERVLTRA